MGKDEDDAELKDIRNDAFDDAVERQRIRLSRNRTDRMWKTFASLIAVSEHPRLVLLLVAGAVALNWQGLWTLIAPLIPGVGK